MNQSNLTIVDSEDTNFHDCYDKYTNINKRLLRAVGLWPYDSSRREPFHQRAMTFLHLFVLSGLTSSQFYHAYLIWGNLFDVLEIFCNTTTAILVVHKALVFYYKKNAVLEFEAQNRNMWASEFKETKNREMMIEAARTGQRLTQIFIGIVFFTVTIFLVSPAIHIFGQWRRGISRENMTFVLPFLTKLPGDLHNPVHHVLCYVPQILTCFSLICYIAGIDSFHFVAIQHITLHLRLLQTSLVQTVRRQRDYGFESPVERIRECIRKHKVLIQLSTLLEQIYSPIILGLCVLSTLSMCMVIFHAVVTMGGHNGNIALFLMYLSLEVSEVLLYCWFGNTLSHQSLAVSSAAYNIEWYEDLPNKMEFASCVRIIIIRAQKPLKLTAYKFADVSLELFTTIMSSTASYFALLRTLYED